MLVVRCYFGVVLMCNVCLCFVMILVLVLMAGSVDVIWLVCSLPVVILLVCFLLVCFLGVLDVVKGKFP